MAVLFNQYVYYSWLYLDYIMLQPVFYISYEAIWLQCVILLFIVTMN